MMAAFQELSPQIGVASSCEALQINDKRTNGKKRTARERCPSATQLKRQSIGQQSADHSGYYVQRTYRRQRRKAELDQRHHRPSFERFAIAQRLQPFSGLDQPPDQA